MKAKHFIDSLNCGSITFTPYVRFDDNDSFQSYTLFEDGEILLVAVEEGYRGLGYGKSLVLKSNKIMKDNVIPLLETNLSGISPEELIVPDEETNFYDL